MIFPDWLESIPANIELVELEHLYVLYVLKKNAANRTHTARSLGISLRGLRNKIAEMIVRGIEVPMPINGRPRDPDPLLPES